MNDQSNSQKELNKVLEKIQEIVEKSADKDYIYRGEPECYPKVCSSLYRVYPHVEGQLSDIEGAQAVILEEVRSYTDITDPVEILTELQHFGGKTNYIDFTEDYLIALFFACDGSLDKPGRLLFLNQHSREYKFRKPKRTIERVKSQKSIFVESSKGFVEVDIKIPIPANLKLPMLSYLRQHRKISVETMYKDIHGFIKRSAYTGYLKGLTCQRKADKAKLRKIKLQHANSAIEHFSEAIRTKPNFVVCYLDRGNAYSIKNELEPAISDYSKAIELKPDYVEAYSNRGNAFRDMGMVEEAIQDYDKAIELNLHHAFIYNNRGNAYRDKGKLDKAIQDYDKTIELDPDCTDAYNGRGNSYLMKGELDFAISDYNKAIDLTPNDPLPYNNRGNVNLRKGELKQSIQADNGIGYSSNNYFDSAIKDYKKAIELDPDYANAYCNLGTVYREIGEFEKAIEKLTKSIELDPKLILAYYNRGQTWLFLHEWEKAMQDLTVAKDMDLEGHRMILHS